MLSSIMVTVLVYLGHHNKMLQIKWLKEQKLIFPIVLEAGKSKIRVPGDLFSVFW